ncbi:MAG: glycoside hydrolase family 31 protein [Prevotellaceae bacterium]|jgi:alpha-glucosidase|nr:glycoside hydrolase family 31 protein [Prevotellaceae bacterium]
MNAIVKDAGRVLSHIRCVEGLFLHCENADVAISFYSPSVVRCNLSFVREFEPFSYAVQREPEAVPFDLEENDGFITLATSEFITRIDLDRFAVAFTALDGTIINRDEPGLFNSMTDNHVTAYKSLQRNERFIGLGEKCGSQDKAGKGYTNSNTDSFAYGTDTDPLYSSIPFYIGLHDNLHNGVRKELCYGIFLDNTRQTDFNFGASNRRFSSFGARGGNLDYYFIAGKSVGSIIESYTALTGRMTMPPLWTLGYHQCRYSYYPEATVRRIAETMRENRIPCDSITLDIHYMDKYKVFSWDSERFPRPAELLSDLNNMGFKTTLIFDPGICADTDDAKEKDIFVKYPDGQDYEAEVWPGWCKFPDFTNPKAREWWAQRLDSMLDFGVEGVWNDMNEIATWGQKMPDNLIFDFEGHKASHLKARNVYGLLMARTAFETFVASRSRRPFVLTRAAYAGIQSYSAVWTGDSTAADANLLSGVRMLTGLGLSGVAFVGMDVGGFLGEPSTTLYVRQMQIGAFMPYMRNHKQINTKSSEPWTCGEEAMEIARNYIRLRYRLIPYIYSAFRTASLTGMPVMRSLAIRFPFNDAVYDTLFENQYFFGDALMIAPSDSVQNYGAVYFPETLYYSLYNDEKFEPGVSILPLSLHTLPAFVAAGSIVPMQDPVQHTGEHPGDTLYLHVYKGKTATEFVYYEDDGESFDYQRGDFHERRISYLPAESKIVIDKPSGTLPSKFPLLKLLLHGFGRIGTASLNGQEARPLTEEECSFLDPVSAFDPQGWEKPLSGCCVKTLELPNDSERMEISLHD